MLYFWKNDSPLPNKLYPILFALLFLIGGGCTKDDICSETTQTTALLVIEFKDITDRITDKAVQDLSIQVNDIDSTQVITSVNDVQVIIPLTTEADITSLLFTLNANSEDNANIDAVIFNYEREEVYVNRACSFKMIYNNIVISVEEDSQNWILDTEVLNPIVENENEVHITIFH